MIRLGTDATASRQTINWEMGAKQKAREGWEFNIHSYGYYVRRRGI